MKKKLFILSWLIIFLTLSLRAQVQEPYPFFKPAESFDKKRLYLVTGTAGVTYIGVSVVLWEAWYKEIGISPFHFFNDWNEWERMDKFGHLTTAYYQARIAQNGLMWAGVDRKKAMWAGAAIGTGLQLTIEIMDGFGDKWGFSVPDIAFNTIGVGMMVAQEMLWEEQRIAFKVSSSPLSYPETPVFSEDGQYSTTIRARANDLFGESFTEKFLKDYNAQTLWASFNIHSLLPQKDNRFPKWLNVAVGYGAENMLEGDDDTYSWTTTLDNDETVVFVRDPLEFPRYQQFYLSLDVDLRHLPIKNRALKTFLSIFNFIKIPAPALEINGLGQVKGHWLR